MGTNNLVLVDVQEIVSCAAGKPSQFQPPGLACDHRATTRRAGCATRLAGKARPPGYVNARTHGAFALKRAVRTLGSRTACTGPCRTRIPEQAEH